MASHRPPSPLVQRWLEWMDRHCALKGHPVHLRYQCRESRKIACRGASLWEDPHVESSKKPAPPEAARWLEWQERSCTVRGHNAHLRYQCRESREQALRGCVVLDVPEE
jgi:hypothetical protein